MNENTAAHTFRSVFSLEPLLDYWKKDVTPFCTHMSVVFKDIEQQLAHIPELRGAIDDLSILEKHQDILMPLMSVVFPAASWGDEVSGALTAYSSEPVYVSPEFKRLLVDENGTFKGRYKEDLGPSEQGRLLRAYFLILNKIYGIHQGIEMPIIRIVQDPDTQLDRYFRINPDLRFVEVRTIGEPISLSDEDRKTIIDNIADPEALARFIPAHRFELRGFTVIRAMDVTGSEVISALQKDLTDQESIFSIEGLGRVQERLQVLFGRPDLKVDMGALLGDQVLVISEGCQTDVNCIFKNSQHLPLAEIQESVWLRAANQGSLLRIKDLRAEPNLTPPEQQLVSHGARSLIIAPLRYQGDVIGTLDLMSPYPNDLGPVDVMLARQIAPLFSVALKRGLDEMNNEVQSIIKEKCTAVHPSVEWRFQKAALSHMDRLRTGHPSEMEPIIFKSVIPLFAQSDIRGSSEARNRSIQADLTEQLNLAGGVMKRAEETRTWPFLGELKYRIDKRIEDVKIGLASGDEASVTEFLGREVEPTFEELMRLGPGVMHAIEKYHQAIDPQMGVVYRKRKEFEESVSTLNETLSSHLDKEQADAQSVFPHYFEKHQTDGVDYIIYLGASMTETGTFNPFYLKNLALWQIIVACGMAWNTERIKPELKVPLDTCHLILVNHTPLSIRFRYDEKRFDVDGAYDVRHEIIKSRIDKAVVKRTGDRLTQPGRIAIVYSQTEEGLETQQHIEYLQAKGSLLDDLEFLDIEDLPGVRGLKALRVGVNVEEGVMIQAKEMMVR
jgi:GAF domain-containing protein